MQHAKVNKALRVHPVRRSTDQQSAARNLSPTPPKPLATLPLMHRNRLTQPSAKHKQADDGLALRGPKRIGVKVLFDVAKLVQVKAKVEHRHPDNGKAAQGVYGVESFVM